MRYFLLPVFLLSFAAHAAEMDRVPALCRDAAQNIMLETNASLERVSPAGESVFLRHFATRDLRVSCIGGAPSVHLATQRPDEMFFKLAGAAGATIVPEKAADIQKLARACWKAATVALDEESERSSRVAAAQCAYDRDGKSGSVTIFRRR